MDFNELLSMLKGPKPEICYHHYVSSPSSAVCRAFPCERVNALGEPLPTKASSLKRPARLRPDLSRKDDEPMALPDRKIVVEPLEW